MEKWRRASESPSVETHGRSGCLRGCLVGGALVVLLGVGALVAFDQWLSRPGRQVSTDFVISERSVGFVRFLPLPDDPGMQALRQQARERIRSLVVGDRWFSGAAGFALSVIGERLLPTEFTISLEPSPDDERDDPAWVLAFNPRGYTRLLSFYLWIVAAEEGEESPFPPFPGRTLARLNDASYWAFLGGTGLTSPSEQTLRRAMERLPEGTGLDTALTGPAGSASLPPPPDGGWDLTGWLMDGGAFVRRVDWNEDEAVTTALAETLASAGEVVFGLDVESSGRIRGVLWIETSTSDEAETLAEALRATVASDPVRDWTVTVSTQGSRVVAELTGVAMSDSSPVETLPDSSPTGPPPRGDRGSPARRPNSSTPRWSMRSWKGPRSPEPRRRGTWPGPAIPSGPLYPGR